MGSASSLSWESGWILVPMGISGACESSLNLCHNFGASEGSVSSLHEGQEAVAFQAQSPLSILSNGPERLVAGDPPTK